MISAAEVAATLQLLVPGFVALKTFYWFGLRTRRTDLEWTLWSVLAAAAIGAVVDLVPQADPRLRLLLGVAIAVVGGWVAARAWREMSRRNVSVRAHASRTVWDLTFAADPTTRYVQVRTTDGRMVFGWPEAFADSVDADDPDLLLRNPSWISDEGQQLPMDGVDGVLIRASSIALVQLLELGEAIDESPS